MASEEKRLLEQKLENECPLCHGVLEIQERRAQCRACSTKYERSGLGELLMMSHWVEVSCYRGG